MERPEHVRIIDDRGSVHEFENAREAGQPGDREHQHGRNPRAQQFDRQVILRDSGVGPSGTVEGHESAADPRTLCLNR